MSSISFWVNSVQADLENSLIHYSVIPLIHSIRFLKPAGQLNENTIYIGSVREIQERVPADSRVNHITFVTNEDTRPVRELAQEHNLNILHSDSDFLTMQNALAAVSENYQMWRFLFQECMVPGSTIQNIIDTAYRLTGCSVILLNAGNRVIYQRMDEQFSDTTINRILDQGYVNQTDSAALFDNPGASRTAKKYLDGTNVCFIHRIFKDGSLISNMIFCLSKDQPDLDIYTLMDLVQNSIHRLVAVSDELPYWAGQDFKILLKEIVEGRIVKEEDINRHFSLLACDPGVFCNFVIIKFAEEVIGTRKLTNFLSSLEQIFLNSNVAVYDDCIVLLINQPKRPTIPKIQFPDDSFLRLLTMYGAYASISNATSRRKLLRTHYKITKSILDIGMRLSSSSSDRIFYFEDYAEYFLIDLSIESFKRLLGHEDIVLLMHPEALHLIRYDQKHKTNLMELVNYYCLSNCNIQQTAKVAFMHRNTVSARLEKIHELITADFSDGEIQSRFIFSYKVYKYYMSYSDHVF